MRALTIWRAISLLLLLSGMFVGPALLDQEHATLVLAKDHGDGNKEDGDNGDHNRGHGNDPDGFDEDNPGNGNGPNKDKDKDKEKEHDDHDHVDDPNPQNTGVAVSQAEEYLVEVTCTPGEAAGTTSCTFTGIAPDDASDVSLVAVPEDDVCAKVTGGTFEHVAPDPNTGVTGYKSRGSDAALTLVLDGNVTTAGTATYWLKTGDGVFPSTGPGLRCEAAAPGSTTQAPPATPDAKGNSGELLVQTFSCANVPDDTETFDWYGECDQADTAHRFTLAGASTPDDQRSLEADPSGEALVTSLAPGTYQLEIVDTSWCHAESDRVTSAGEVVIEAGQRTTVWGFICTGPDAP